MDIKNERRRCRDGVICVFLCTLPSIHLVCVVFGTAIPTSFYILENVFHTSLCAFLLYHSTKLYIVHIVPGIHCHHKLDMGYHTCSTNQLKCR